MRSPLASLKKQADFKRAFACGKSAAGPLFVVYAAANDLEYSRLGLLVSKKTGNAVTRNRIKRLVKESLRLIFAEKTGQAPKYFDLIVIARTPAGELTRKGSFAEVNDALAKLLVRLSVVS